MTDQNEHIRRLQGVRLTGQFNMFTELRDGLEAIFGEQEADETMEWVEDNWEYFESGDWTEDIE